MTSQNRKQRTWACDYKLENLAFRDFVESLVPGAKERLKKLIEDCEENWLEGCMHILMEWKMHLPQDVQSRAPQVRYIYKREDPDFINHNDISFADKVDHMFFGWRHVHYTSDEQLEEGHADFAIICHETDHDRKNLDFLEETFIWSHVGARYKANPALDEENMELRDEIQGEVEDTVGLIFGRLQFNSKYGWERDINTRRIWS